MTVRSRRARHIRHAAVALLTLAGAMTACTRRGNGAQAVPAAEAGATSAAAAVEGFLAAARVGDPRTMGFLFGTPAGPIAGRDAPADVEKRMRALACYLTHDSARIVDDLPAVAAGNRRLLTVALRQRELARETRFTVAPTGRGRWLVESFDIERLSDFCRPS